MASGRHGVNIFVNWALAKASCACVGKRDGRELFEVASEDADGDPIQRKHRLRAFHPAQSVFYQR